MIPIGIPPYTRIMNRLDQIAEQIQQNSQPPVHLWAPEAEGEIDIYIDSRGAWFHEGDMIKRESLVALFACILWGEEGVHYLVTPIEKLKIKVDDVPFVVNQMEAVGDAWVATTNVHEQVIIGSNHRVELRQYKDQWIPYVNVRYDLWARVNRSIYYQWVETALEQDSLTLSSVGYEFLVARA